MSNKALTKPPIKSLILAGDILRIPQVDYYTIMQSSERFPIKFPINSTRVKALTRWVKADVLDRNANSAYPLIHENALNLYANFLLYKRNEGSDIEKNLYKDMSVMGLVERFLLKRAVSFLGPQDKFRLVNGAVKSASKWEDVGKPSEGSPLLLRDCLSYDEMKLSAFLSVSSYTYFLNSGNRTNRGIMDHRRGDIEDEGVIVGLIGPRMEKPGVMDHEDIIEGYPEFMRCLYGVSDGDCGEDVGRFTKTEAGEVFDNVIYAKRLAVSFDTLLVEANQRAKDRGKTAYVHVVGIGLGVWKRSVHQYEVFLDTFAERIEYDFGL